MEEAINLEEKTKWGIAAKNFSTWNELLQTKNATKVAALYLPSATFLPTLSGEFKKDLESFEQYFERFLIKNPVGEIMEDEVQILSPDSYVHSGLYDFELDEDGGRKSVKARFTFIWQKDETGQWKIIHHHSSVMPS